MERVRGIGGIFFRSQDPKALAAWYRDHLGVPVEAWGGASFVWKDLEGPGAAAATIWSPFAADTTYFAPSEASFMINFRVADLDAMLAQLRAGGCDVQDALEESDFGRFGWVVDPDGNKVELWEPPAESAG